MSRRTVLSTAVVIAALAGLNLARHVLPWDGVWFSVVAATTLLVFARRRGLSWAQLGLGKDHLRTGSAWALGAIVVVAGIYSAGVLLPLTRPAFLDARYQLGVPEAMLTAFLLIPIRTVLLEEVAFRSVLWGMLARHMTTWWVILTSSALFGLWHILPSLSSVSADSGVNEMLAETGTAETALIVVGTVVFTTLGGIVAGELRRRSGSVLASAGMHWATNALGVLFGLVAWRLAAG